MTTDTEAGLTTIELLELFWRVHWASYSPTSRMTRRGRLVMMAASLLDDPSAAQSIVARVREQNPHFGVQRPDDTSRDAFVARFLLDYFLPAPEYSGLAHTEPDSPELAEAASWVISHSKPAREITVEDLVRLRSHLGGQTYLTRRTYWAFTEKVIHWAVLTGHIERDPTVGLPPLPRHLDAERVNPDRVPSEEEVWAIARAGGTVVGEWFKVAVLLGSFGALRIGELVALRRQHLRTAGNGGLWLTVDTQRRRYSKRYSDDGITSNDFAPPKGRPTASGGRRRCYIPSRVAWAVAEYIDCLHGEQPLFTNSWGKPMSTEAFRYAWKRVMDTEPVGPRLTGITPHTMRRTGMSIWLRQGLDLKLIQSWGGWHSLTVMLDTYAALLPGAEEDSIALLEGRRSPNRQRTSSQKLPGLRKSVSSGRPSSRRDGAIGG